MSGQAGATRIFEDSVIYWVHRVFQASRRTMYNTVPGFDSPEEWLVLVFLWLRDGQTVTELCDAMFRDRKAVSRFVMLLEQNGLIERQTSSQNKAAHMFLLTAEGRERMGQMLPLFRRFVAAMSAGISPRDLAATRRTLQRMVDNLDPLKGEPLDGEPRSIPVGSTPASTRYRTGTHRLMRGPATSPGRRR
jgi:DNA-binding MarR family transcriptional regulator